MYDNVRYSVGSRKNMNIQGKIDSFQIYLFANSDAKDLDTLKMKDEIR